MTFWNQGERGGIVTARRGGAWAASPRQAAGNRIFSMSSRNFAKFVDFSRFPAAGHGRPVRQNQLTSLRRKFFMSITKK